MAANTGGSIVNIASILALRPGSKQVNYGAGGFVVFGLGVGLLSV